jgi:hypothetical protein
MNKILTTGLALGTLFFSAGQAQAGSLVIDTFNTRFHSVEVEVPLQGQVDFSLLKDSDTNTDSSSSIVGGYRNLFIEMTSATTRGSEAKAAVAEELAVANGLLTIDNGSGVASNTIVTWDSKGAGLGIDLLANGENTDAFDLDIDSIDLDANLTFTVMGNNGETATLTKKNDKTATLPQSAMFTVGNNLFSYKDFIISNGSYTDVFSSVKSIALKVSGSGSLDATFDSINAVNTGSTPVVPEPTSVLSLLSIIAFGANFCARGKFSKKL